MYTCICALKKVMQIWLRADFPNRPFLYWNSKQHLPTKLFDSSKPQRKTPYESTIMRHVCESDRSCDVSLLSRFKILAQATWVSIAQWSERSGAYPMVLGSIPSRDRFFLCLILTASRVFCDFFSINPPASSPLSVNT